MSRKVVNKGGIGVGAPYDFPGYEYDPVNDSFKDLETGKTFTKDGNAKLEASKSVTVSENGPQIITPSPTYDGMEKVVLDVQVPAGADLEANHAETIDVSQYTEPVEIIPASGKDGMEKCTVTLSNIPSGGATTPLYAWKNENEIAYTLTPNPDSDSSQSQQAAWYDWDAVSKTFRQSFGIWNTDGSSYITWDESTYERDSSLDMIVSGPVQLAFDGDTVLPTGQKVYMFADHNPSTGTADVFCLDTDGVSTPSELFWTAGAEGSPVYAGTMGNIHFFAPYTG